MKEILIIENDLQVKKLLTLLLESNGFLVRLADNSISGFELASHFNPDLIIYSYDYNDGVGLGNVSLLKSWYKNDIFILSEIDDEEIIIRALELGITDFIIKPFRSRELVARVKNHLNKRESIENKIPKTKLVFDDLEIDLYKTTIKKNGELIKLSKTEHSLLVLLAKNEGRVMSHSLILKEIWGIGSQTNTYRLRVVLGRLRKKIETDLKNPKHIITMNGLGIMFQ